MQSLASQFEPLKKKKWAFSFLKPINQTRGENFICEQNGDHGFFSQDQSVKEGRSKEQRYAWWRRQSSIRMKQIENTWHKRQHAKRKGVSDKGWQHKDKKSQMRQHKYKEDVKEKSKGKKSWSKSNPWSSHLGVHWGIWAFITFFSQPKPGLHYNR